MPRRYRGPVREAKKERTQALILESALVLFAERGFEGASVRDIAARAGVTHAVIRLHYGTKEGLWQNMLTFLFDRFQAEMRAGEDDVGLGDRDRLRAFVRNYVRYCARHPEHARIMVQASLDGGDRLDWSVDRFVAPAHRRITPLLKRSIQAGLLPDLPIMSMIYILSAASQMIFALAGEAERIYGVDPLTPEIVDAHADAICRLLTLQADGKK